jgi:hypothetical protein
MAAWSDFLEGKTSAKVVPLQRGRSSPFYDERSKVPVLQYV